MALPDEVVLVLPVALAREHHPDRAGLRVHGDEGGVGALLRVHLREDRFLRVALPLGVERRVDPQAALVQRVDPLGVGDAERVELAGHVVQDQLADVRDEERLQPLLRRSGVRRQPERSRRGLLALALCHHAERDHPADHEVPPRAPGSDRSMSPTRP